MLDKSNTRIDRMYETDALSTVAIDAEGACLQLAMDNGVRKARPSNAAADTIFMGVSWGIPRQGNSLTTTKIERVTAVGTTAPLAYAPTSGADMMVFVGQGYGGTLLTYDADGAPVAGAWSLGGDGKSIVLNAAETGATLFVVYRYAPTVAQAKFLWGETFPGQQANSLFNRIGVITSGLVFTDQFDTAVNWGAVDTEAAGEIVRGGPNGRFTVGGTGCVCNGVYVVQAPNIDYPYLGLKIGLLA